MPERGKPSGPGSFKLLKWRSRVKTFIRVTEIWVPSANGVTLEFGGGLYGPLDDLRELSEKSKFGYNEGLPGTAWAKRHPIVLKDFSNSYFQRADAARAVGLTCGIAMPIFAGDVVKAVVVFLCGSDEKHVGAIEVWNAEAKSSGQIGLYDGYYGEAELFEWKSRHTKFGLGNGLPGRVWQSGMPVIMRDLYRPGQFLRWEEAQQVGLNSGLGLPCPYDPERAWVMTFLSALGTPIARRFEIWVPDAEGHELTFSSGTCEKTPTLAEDYEFASFAPGEGLAGGVWKSGVPAVTEDLSGEPERQRASLAAAGWRAAVAMPVLTSKGATAAVVSWYF